jgi:hypothetical protein
MLPIAQGGHPQPAFILHQKREMHPATKHGTTREHESTNCGIENRNIRCISRELLNSPILAQLIWFLITNVTEDTGTDHFTDRQSLQRSHFLLG